MVKVKKLEAGDTVSYGATYTADEPQWVATLPVGYADGFIRAYNKRGSLGGRRSLSDCWTHLHGSVHDSIAA